MDASRTVSRRRHPWLVSALALSLLGTTPSAWSSAPRGPNSVRFRYGLRAGASYDMTMVMSVGLQVDAEGLTDPASLALEKGFQQDVNVRMVLEVGQAAADGSKPVAYRVRDAKGKMTLGGEHVEQPDLKEIVWGSVLKGRLTDEGRTIELEKHGLRALPGPSSEMMSRMLEAMPALPDRELRIGDSFEVPVRLEMPDMPTGGKADVTSTATFTLVSIGERDAVFHLRAVLSTGSDTETSETMNMSMIGGSVGRAVFDLAEGIFRTVHTDMTMEMNIDIPMDPDELPQFSEPSPDARRADPDAKPGRMKMKMSARGPLDFTMTRAAADR